MTAFPATPTKLRSGAWGATTSDRVDRGDQLEITARSGKAWLATVERVVWRGDGKAIVATVKSTSNAPTRVVSSSGSYDGDERCYRGHTTPTPGCHDCFDLWDM